VTNRSNSERKDTLFTWNLQSYIPLDLRSRSRLLLKDHGSYSSKFKPVKTKLIQVVAQVGQKATLNFTSDAQKENYMTFISIQINLLCYVQNNLVKSSTRTYFERKKTILSVTYILIFTND